MEDRDHRKVTFDISDCSRYKLSIQAGLDGFLFCVQDPADSEILWWQSFQWRFSGYGQLIRKVKELFNEPNRNSLSFAEVSISISDPRFVMIPQPLFSEKVATRLLASEKSPSIETELEVNPLHQIEAVLAFLSPVKLAAFFRGIFEGIVINHEITLLLTNFLKMKTEGLFVHFHDRWFAIFSFQNGKPDLISSFGFHSGNDILYYILSILNLPGNNDLQVFLSGEIEEEDDKFLLLKTHIPGIVLFKNIFHGNFPFPSEIPVNLFPGVLTL